MDHNPSWKVMWVLHAIGPCGTGGWSCAAASLNVRYGSLPLVFLVIQTELFLTQNVCIYRRNRAFMLKNPFPFIGIPSVNPESAPNMGQKYQEKNMFRWTLSLLWNLSEKERSCIYSMILWCACIKVQCYTAIHVYIIYIYMYMYAYDIVVIICTVQYAWNIDHRNYIYNGNHCGFGRQVIYDSYHTIKKDEEIDKNTSIYICDQMIICMNLTFLNLLLARVAFKKVNSSPSLRDVSHTSGTSEFQIRTERCSKTPREIHGMKRLWSRTTKGEKKKASLYGCFQK